MSQVLKMNYLILRVQFRHRRTPASIYFGRVNQSQKTSGVDAHCKLEILSYADRFACSTYSCAFGAINNCWDEVCSVQISVL